jgi:mRNA interferase HigB
MRVITNKRLVMFGARHPDAAQALQVWRRLIESKDYGSFSDLRQVFGSVDHVGDKYVFDIRGNRYRLIVSISFALQLCFIKHVLTHKEYDRGHWK